MDKFQVYNVQRNLVDKPKVLLPVSSDSVYHESAHPYWGIGK
jgi:hypothetical protein